MKVVLAVAAVLAAIAALLLLARRRARGAVQGAIVKGSGAQLFGAPGVVIRGTGYLVMTDDELVFALALPFTLLRVALADVSSVEVRPGYAGRRTRSGGADAGVLCLTGGESPTNEYAFQVPEVSVWLQEIRRRSGATPT